MNRRIRAKRLDHRCSVFYVNGCHTIFESKSNTSGSLNMDNGSICTSHLDKLHINKRHCFSNKFFFARSTASSCVVRVCVFGCMFVFCVLLIFKVSLNFSISCTLLPLFSFFILLFHFFSIHIKLVAHGPVHFVWRWIFNETKRNDISTIPPV